MGIWPAGVSVGCMGPAFVGGPPSRIQLQSGGLALLTAEEARAVAAELVRRAEGVEAGSPGAGSSLYGLQPEERSLIEAVLAYREAHAFEESSAGDALCEAIGVYEKGRREGLPHASEVAPLFWAIRFLASGSVLTNLVFDTKEEVDKQIAYYNLKDEIAEVVPLYESLPLQEVLTIDQVVAACASFLNAGAVNMGHRGKEEIAAYVGSEADNLLAGQWRQHLDTKEGAADEVASHQRTSEARLVCSHRNQREPTCLRLMGYCTFAPALCSRRQQQIAPLAQEKAVTELRSALKSLRRYFGTLQKEEGERGTSAWQVARDAFAVLDRHGTGEASTDAKGGTK